MGIENGVERGRWAQVEAARDREWMAWLGRFRFVTSELAGQRFLVSERRARSRLKRLVEAKLVEVQQPPGVTGLYSLSRAGAQRLGQPGRREPRIEIQRAHELAIVQLSVQLELAAPGLTVLTERQCRQLTAKGLGRYSVEVQAENGRPASRWPDLILETARGSVALEIELAPKTTARLGRILRGYLVSDLAEVRFLVADRLLAARLKRTADDVRLQLPLRNTEALTKIVVDAWSGAPVEEQQAIRAA
jgi:hypothetical protein